MKQEPSPPIFEEAMTTPKVTEIRRLSPHRQQVAYVRASLLRGVDDERKASRHR
jgi:hypothetical protein